MDNILIILLQIGDQIEEPTRGFYIFFIISTIVVHAIVIAIVYFVFKDFFKKKDLEEKEGLRKTDNTSK